MVCDDDGDVDHVVDDEYVDEHDDVPPVAPATPVTPATPNYLVWLECSALPFLA